MLVNSGEMTGGKKGAAPSPPVISPTYFKRTVSNVAWASIDFGAAIQMPRPKGAAARAGLRFERDVFSKLSKIYKNRLLFGVPLSFQEVHRHAAYSRPQTAIPDGFLLSRDGKSLGILEVKLRHSTDAWFQLNKFYLPLVRRVAGSSLVLRTVEICRYYDPGVKLPKEKRILDELDQVFDLRSDCHPVLIWGE